MLLVPGITLIIMYSSLFTKSGSSINNDNNNRKLNYKHVIKYYNLSTNLEIQ